MGRIKKEAQMNTLMLRNQSTIETLISRRNIHWILANALEEELDQTLFDWTLFMASRFDVWYSKALENGFYESKNIRLQKLTPWLEEYGLDHLMILVLSAVLAPAMMGKTTCTYQQAVGYLTPYMPHEDPFDAAKTAAELIAIGSSGTYIYCVEPQGSGNLTVIKVYVTPEVDKALSPAVDWINNTGYNPPLVEPPMHVTNNKNCGYHTFNESLLLGKFTKHNKPLNLPAINAANNIQWILDPEVLQEVDEVPTDFNFASQQTKSMFLLQCSKIVSILGSRPFWLAWQYDSRGRMYSHGYHVNFQSYEYRKAMLSFNKYEYLT
jgi:hypothetical protein